jgi:PAS domain S-box-containing protein
MKSSSRKTILRYSLAVAMCLAAVMLRLVLMPVLGDRGPFITMFPMIVFATLLCGVGPGIVATALSTVFANYFLFTSPEFRDVPIATVVLQNLLFVGLSGLVNWTASNRCPVRMFLGEPSADAGVRAEVTEQALRASEEKFKLAERISGYGTWEWDFKTKKISWSEGIYDLLGEKKGPETTEQVWKRIVSPEMLDASTEAIKESVRKKKEDHYFEMELRRSDGSTCWVATRGRIIYAADGSAERIVGVNFDITERKGDELRIGKLNRELRKRVSELQAIFDIVPVGIAFSEDPKCNVIIANRALADMVGVKPDDNVSINSSNSAGIPYKHLKKGRELTQWELPMQRAVAEKRPILDEEIEIVRADGKILSILAHAAPIFDDDGNVIGCVSAQVDVTEKNSLLAEMQRQIKNEKVLRREAEDANKVKDEFLATVSHELRTPLNSIAGWVSLLKREDVDSTILTRGLGAIESSANAQSRLIGDLLDISKIVSGGFRMEESELGLVPILESAVETLRPMAAGKGVIFELEIEPDIGSVSGDACRLEQIFINLIHNAVKFSFDGGEIKVTASRDGAQSVVSVTDHGRGIGRGFLPHVFERFRQEDDSIAKSFSGLGLGLAIAKRLTELHGGTIAVESEGEGKGATFTVRLPATGDSEMPQTVYRPKVEAGTPPLAEPKELSGLTILVVDDEDDSREVMKIFLEQRGARVVTAASSAEALDRFRESRPDFLLSDIGMPGEDGYALIRKIRLIEEEGRSIPAIAVTAFARPEDRSRALASGFDDHISKPVEPGEIVELVRGLAGRGSK